MRPVRESEEEVTCVICGRAWGLDVCDECRVTLAGVQQLGQLDDKERLFVVEEIRCAKFAALVRVDKFHSKAPPADFMKQAPSTPPEQPRKDGAHADTATNVAAGVVTPRLDQVKPDASTAMAGVDVGAAPARHENPPDDVADGATSSPSSPPPSLEPR